jgi:FKBP-type peptidyl-prolyl cis-trans isomerase FklB
MLKKFIMPLVAICTMFFAVSCEESEEVSEYDNWKPRNEHYLDSIASLARGNVDGWLQIPAYTMGDHIGEDASTSYYIYVKKLELGAGSYRPQDGDTVRAHYQGILIPTDSHPQGKIFDKSYATGSFNEATDVPALFAVNSTVVGFSTALMNMVEGDRWKVVMPQYLGYKDNATGDIPAYSTLIFDIKLARVYRNGDNSNTSWH